MSAVNEGELRDLAANAVTTLRGLGASDETIRARLAQAVMLEASGANEDLVATIGSIASTRKVTANDLAALSKQTGQALRFSPSDSRGPIQLTTPADPAEVSRRVSETIRTVRGTGPAAAKASAKLPRIRYFELPMQTAGVYSETPFIIVVDRCPDDLAKSIRDMGNSLRAATGAKGVVVIRQEVSLDE